MIESLVASVAILIPKEAPRQAPKAVPNMYQDSGHHAWSNEPRWVRELAACIRTHESRHDYKAHNATSSAAGAYQFLDSTWQGNAKWTKYQGVYVAKQYKAANHAPAHIQDLVFLHSINHGGVLNWRGTHCGYGT
jgi:hypothetical protein